MANEKLTMTLIGKIDLLETAYSKLLTGKVMTYEEKSLLLATAIMLLEEYQSDDNLSMCFELAYEIIARYSIAFDDYQPLYDLSLNYGFFPIVDYILEKKATLTLPLVDVINASCIDKYRVKNFIATIQQFDAFQGVLTDKNNEVSFIAPTSFGKSELILSHIKQVMTPSLKAAIIVPTKSLLMQTYKNIKNAFPGKKIILHDQMYGNEESFVAVLTQERALRLLEKHDVFFDYIYVDEAHNLFDKDVRNRLLARLLRLAKKKNSDCDILYLSPLVQCSDNLRVLGANKVSEYRIKHNIKIPTYYLYKDNKQYIYNRYFNKFYFLDNCFSSPYEYIKDKATNKNLIYINAPKRMEDVIAKFAATLPENNSSAINQVVGSIKKHVHGKFQMIPLLKKGVVYLHGKLPDYVKDYLEYKAATVADIKYIAANMVLLEGVNLPVSSLFILDAHSLTTNKLVNLCGRVNRLNSIFGGSGDITKLFPPIHFVSNNAFTGNMQTYVERLRTNQITDSLDNPFLENYDMKSLSSEKKKTIQKLFGEEELYFSEATSEVEELYQKMIALALNAHLDLNVSKAGDILNKIKKALQDEAFSQMTIVEKVNYIFLQDTVISDPEIERLKNADARKYYDFYLSVMRSRSLQQNIIYESSYFEQRKDSKDPYIFMGASYGECSRLEDEPYKKWYVNLRMKTKEDLINLSIIKLKIEDDFLSFKFNKFVELLYEYQLITDDDYNLATYGTVDQQEIKLIKQGLPIHLVSKLTKDGQMVNIVFDENNIIVANEEFKQYFDSLDDFYQYQVGKYIYVN